LKHYFFIIREEIASRESSLSNKPVFLLNNQYRDENCVLQMDIGLDPMSDLEPTLLVSKSDYECNITFSRFSFQELIRKNNEIWQMYKNRNTNENITCGLVAISFCEFDNIPYLRLNNNCLFSQNFGEFLLLTHDELHTLLSYKDLFKHHFKRLSVNEVSFFAILRDAMCELVYESLEIKCDGCDTQLYGVVVRAPDFGLRGPRFESRARRIFHDLERCLSTRRWSW
jgi:hypothetical protein